MLRNQTVFVVGAGASYELGLPTGDGLMTKITEVLNAPPNTYSFHNETINRTLAEKIQREHGHNWTGPMMTYKQAAAKIIKALPHARSIDTYLASRVNEPAVVAMGKLAIAYTILEAEKASHVYRGPTHYGTSNKAAGLSHSWYAPLARMLTAGHRVDNLKSVFENVSFIVFNYDRVLETFLTRMLCEYFDIQEMAAHAILGQAKIIHAYGQVGPIIMGRGEQTVPLGGGDGQDLMAIAEGIQTYAESTSSGTAGEIKQLMREAETVVFLGFGYIQQNMQLLSPLTNTSTQKVIGTAYQVSTQNRAEITTSLTRMLGRKSVTRIQDIDGRTQSFDLLLEPITCRQLIDDNMFTLADQ